MNGRLYVRSIVVERESLLVGDFIAVSVFHIIQGPETVTSTESYGKPRTGYWEAR